VVDYNHILSCCLLHIQYSYQVAGGKITLAMAAACLAIYDSIRNKKLQKKTSNYVMANAMMC